MSQAPRWLMEPQGALLLAAAVTWRCCTDGSTPAVPSTVRWAQNGKMTWMCYLMCLAAACHFPDEASVKLLFVLGQCWDTLAAPLQRTGGVRRKKTT